MTQAERRLYLIQYLLWERGEDSQMEVLADDSPKSESGVCLHQCQRSLCAGGDQGQIYLHSGGYRGSVKAVYGFGFLFIV